jgi:dolichol-phosphate mannosyltransferase
MNEPLAPAAKKPLISLVAPCFNEAEVFAQLRRELVALAERLADRYDCEFVLVDDGSRDATWSLIAAFAAADPRVRGVALSRNFGHQLALTAGCDAAAGDAVVSLDADLQDPPAVVPELVREWEKGADVVYAVRRARQGETGMKLLTAKWFYRLFRRIGGAAAPDNVGDFRLLSRRAMTAFGQLREHHRYLRGLVGWMGFRTATVEYDRAARAAGATHYPWKKMIRFAADAIVSFSAFPLRLNFVFGALAAAAAFGFWLATALHGWATGRPLPAGWSSLTLTVALFGTLILLGLGVLGEYVGRIYAETQRRPLYFVRETVGPPPPTAPSAGK